MHFGFSKCWATLFYKSSSGVSWNYACLYNYRPGFRNVPQLTNYWLLADFFFLNVDFDLDKKKLSHRCFPLNFEKFLTRPFPYRTPPVASSDFFTSKFTLVLHFLNDYASDFPWCMNSTISLPSINLGLLLFLRSSKAHIKQN